MNRRFFLRGTAQLVLGVVANNAVASSTRQRFDIPSVLDGNVPRQEDGRPSGPGVVAAVNAGTMQGAGRRTVVFFLWGAGNLPVAEIGAYDHRAPRQGLRPIVVTEIAATQAPRFDPIYEPPGPARAFRITYDGPMFSIELPRALLAQGLFILICGESGRTVFPNRVTAQNGLWLTAGVNRDMAQPRYTFVTTLPFIWQR